MTARAYLRLLGELDLAAYGIHKSLLDRKVALGHLKTLLRTDVVELSLLRRLQTCLGDECIYEDLARLLNEMSRELRSGERTPPPSTHNQTLDAAGTPPGTAAPAIAASTPASIPAAAPPSGAHR